MLVDDNSSLHCANFMNDFLLEEGIIRMEWPAFFSGHEPIRVCLGHSRKTSCGTFTTPTNSSRTGKSSSGGVGQNTLAPHY